jgi:uncharacterized damage-inducible protein DinB
MRYDFLVDTYASERLKVLGTWSSFQDPDLDVRPRAGDARGRSVLEQMVHQCVSENAWFRGMLAIDVNSPPLPEEETRLGFLRRYALDSGARLVELARTDEPWWEASVPFFDVPRTRAWIVVRRIAHTAHHRGQLSALLRVLGRELHSTYGPTADTGGLAASKAPTIYAYRSAEQLLAGEEAGGRKAPLPGPGAAPPTERPPRSGSSRGAPADS